MKVKEQQLKRQIIFDNCMAKKLPKTDNMELNASVTRICDRISKKPNRWQMFWYSD